MCEIAINNFSKMSGGSDAMKAQEADITKMLAATTHLGSENSEIRRNKPVKRHWLLKQFLLLQLAKLMSKLGVVKK